MRPLTLFLLVFALVGSACQSDCRKLSERLCECATNTTDKTICLQTVAVNETYNPPSDDDNAKCKALYDQCDCHLLSSRRGKVQCGIARPYPGYDAGY